MMRYALGVDGGGSKTHALVVEETGRAVGFGQGAGSNYQTSGTEPAVHEIDKAAREALKMAGLTPAQIAQGCFCLAGADFAEDYAFLQERMDSLELAGHVLIKNDTMAALRAGLSRPWGVAIICGTGFNGAGRAPDGREIAFASLGPISGDWGGGAELSMEVIRLVMRAWDGRGIPTRLTQMVLGALGADTEETLLRKLRYQRIGEKDLRSLVPLLFEAALAGDQAAHDLVVRMGTEIGVAANALIRRLSLEDQAVEVVLAGGVIKGKGPLLRETAARVIHSQAPAAQILPLRREPVMGAALLALESMGVAVTSEIDDLLDGSVVPLGLRLASREEAQRRLAD